MFQVKEFIYKYQCQKKKKRKEKKRKEKKNTPKISYNQASQPKNLLSTVRVSL